MTSALKLPEYEGIVNASEEQLAIASELNLGTYMGGVILHTRREERLFTALVEARRFLSPQTVADPTKVPDKIYLHVNLGNDPPFDRFWQGEKIPGGIEYVRSPSPSKVEGMPTREKMLDEILKEFGLHPVEYTAKTRAGLICAALVDARLALTKLKQSHEKDMREAFHYGVYFATVNTGDPNETADPAFDEYLKSKQTEQKGETK